MDMREKLQILNLYLAKQVRPPIDVLSLAHMLGIKVYDAAWPPSISGKIQKDKEKGGTSGYAIFVNKDHSKTRKRFTVAHEVAHYVMHEDMIGDGIFDDALYRSGLSNEVEREANALAANILMPWHLLNPLAATHSPKDLAQSFEVSEQAMSTRLGIFG